MSGPVLWGVPPIATEGLMAFVTRTVSRNFLPSSFTLLRQAGVNHANNPTAAFIPYLDEHRLAEILRVPVDEIARRRHLPRPEVGYVDFFGSAVRADEIIVRTVRFAPAALAASPHSRALWSLKTVPCCTETWQYLTSDCSCGVRQRWQHASLFERCHACNRRLDRLDADVVPEGERDGLAFLLGLVDPDQGRRTAARLQLPTHLAEWDGGMVLELAIALMPLAPDPFRPKRADLTRPADQPRHARALSQTAEIIRGWPASFLPTLKRAVGDRSRSRRNVRYTGIADYIPALNSEILPASIRNEIHECLAPISSPAGDTPAGQIAMMDAVDHMLLPLRMLAKGRREGHLQSHICFRANRLFPTLDRAEVEMLRDQRHNRRSAEAVSRSLELPQYAMQLIADAGHVEMQAHPFLISVFQMHQMDKREHAGFLDRLRAASVSVEGEDVDGEAENDLTVPLHRVARAIGGGFKPWGVIFDRLLREIQPTPFRLTGKSISRICIRQQDADAILRMNLRHVRPSSLVPHCSQRDALEILNLPAKHAHVLTEFAGADDSWEMDWDTVIDLARRRITLTEMSARTGIQGFALEVALEQVGCPRRDRLGWMREEAISALPDAASLHLSK